MNKTVIAAALALMVVGCTPKQRPVEYARTVFAVEASVEVNDKTMTVAWKKSGEGMIGGYNVYISEERLAAKHPASVAKPSFRPFNEEPFPGDTNPDDGVEYFVADGLDNGVRYYVSVRAIYPDGSVSKPSNEVEVVCGPRGEIELAVRYEGEPSGFSFERNAPVKADATDSDIYFFSKRFADILGSPERLNGFLRQTRFLVLPFGGSFDEVRKQLAQNPLRATKKSVPVKQGEWVLIQTPEQKSALVQVVGFSGEQGSDRRVTLAYAFSALVGEAVF
ncbi:MAG: fibronectin type III domain-containing protein [bacterium]|nr:fibronectin type III domain-containing protein [bacterium]